MPTAESPAPQTSTASLWQNCLTGRLGMALALAWGLAEATLFFLVPDILITLAALFAPRRSAWHLGVAVVGAMIGGSVMYCWAAAKPEAASGAVADVPFVYAWMFQSVIADYGEHGLWAPCFGVTSGIPYKIYAIEAPAHVGFVPFVLVSALARLGRLLLTWASAAAVGLLASRQIQTRPRAWLALLLAMWTVFYVWYWTTIGRA